MYGLWDTCISRRNANPHWYTWPGNAAEPSQQPTYSILVHVIYTCLEYQCCSAQIIPHLYYRCTFREHSSTLYQVIPRSQPKPLRVVPMEPFQGPVPDRYCTSLGHSTVHSKGHWYRSKVTANQWLFQ